MAYNKIIKKKAVDRQGLTARHVNKSLESKNCWCQDTVWLCLVLIFSQLYLLTLANLPEVPWHIPRLRIKTKRRKLLQWDSTVLAELEFCLPMFVAMVPTNHGRAVQERDKSNRAKWQPYVKLFRNGSEETEEHCSALEDPSTKGLAGLPRHVRTRVLCVKRGWWM